jgi:hypothetical protein
MVPRDAAERRLDVEVAADEEEQQAQDQQRRQPRREWKEGEPSLAAAWALALLPLRLLASRGREQRMKRSVVRA